MAKAFIMVNTAPTETNRIAERLKAIRGAVVYEVFGPFDFIVDLEADTPEDLAATLRNSIRSLRGVNTTLTCSVM